MTKTQIKALEVVAAAGRIEEGAARTSGAHINALRKLAETGVLVSEAGTFSPKVGPYAGQELPTVYYSVA